MQEGLDWGDLKKFDNVPLGKKNIDLREKKDTASDNKENSKKDQGNAFSKEVKTGEECEVNDWNDLRKYDDDHDSDWFKAEEKKMADLYGGKFIRVKYMDHGRVAYLCELCMAECNAKKSLELHCNGMKHLKKKDLWEKDGKPNTANLSKDWALRTQIAAPKAVNDKKEKPERKRSPVAAPRPRGDDRRSRGGRDRDYDREKNYDRDRSFDRERGLDMRDRRPAYNDRGPKSAVVIPPLASFVMAPPHLQHRLSLEPPHFGHEQPHGRREPAYNSREPPYNSREPPYNSREPPYNSREPPYNSREPPFDSREPPNDRRDPTFNDREPPYNSREPKYHSRGEPPYNIREPPFKVSDRDPLKYGAPREPDYPGRNEKRRRSPEFMDRYRGAANRSPPAPLPPPPPTYPTKRSPSPEANLYGSPAGTLLQKLSECCVKTVDDADLALNVVAALSKSLKEFSERKGEHKIAELLMEAELKFSTVKALKVGMKILAKSGLSVSSGADSSMDMTSLARGYGNFGSNPLQGYPNSSKLSEQSSNFPSFYR